MSNNFTLRLIGTNGYISNFSDFNVSIIKKIYNKGPPAFLTDLKD